MDWYTIYRVKVSCSIHLYLMLMFVILGTVVTAEMYAEAELKK